MNITDFRKECGRTLPDLKSPVNDSLHMTVGMSTELGEINKAFLEADEKVDMINVAEEVGDLFWYYGNFANMHNFVILVENMSIPSNVEPLTKLEDGVEELGVLISQLLDLDKKAFAYGKFIELEDRLVICEKIDYYLAHFIHFYKLDLSDILSKNIRKLKARYPDKFDPEKAINRDLDSERKILESQSLN